MNRGALGVFQTEREHPRRHVGARQERVVLRNRAVAPDAQHAAGEIAALVGVQHRVALVAVEIRVVEPEAIGTGHEQVAVASELDAPLGAVGQVTHGLEPRVVLAQTGPRHLFHADVQEPPLGQRLGPHVLVEEVQRPRARRLARRRREVGEVERSVAREVGVEQQIVQSVRADRLDARHAGNRRRHDAVGLHDPHRAAVLRDQEVAVGQKRDGPRAGETSGDRLDVERWRGTGRWRRVRLPWKGRRRLGRLRGQRDGEQRENNGGGAGSGRHGRES